MECVDFLQFQDTLKKMRDMDDKLVYALNCQLPTPSFRSNPASSCEDLYQQLVNNYKKRESSIRGCIDLSRERVNELKTRRDSGDDNVSKSLSKEQTKLRLLQSELNVEEIVKDRSLKLYYERCREFFKPPNMNVS